MTVFYNRIFLNFNYQFYARISTIKPTRRTNGGVETNPKITLSYKYFIENNLPENIKPIAFRHALNCKLYTKNINDRLRFINNHPEKSYKEAEEVYPQIDNIEYVLEANRQEMLKLGITSQQIKQLEFFATNNPEKITEKYKSLVEEYQEIAYKKNGEINRVSDEYVLLSKDRLDEIKKEKQGILKQIEKEMNECLSKLDELRSLIPNFQDLEYLILQSQNTETN